MARVSGKNGAVTLPSGLNADLNRFSLSGSHPVDDDTAYGDTLFGASHHGCGTITYSADCGGFLKSNVASTAPGVGLASSTVVLADVDGASTTFTHHTGCTHVGTFIPTGFNISHAKRSGAIPISYSGVIDGDLVETWATA
ncbi:MAG TPA: hypothetical protein VD994_00935 [Prosthecobacter sp.]|nr:hypothetical protein [Prosthecobacter sp.]